MSREPWDATIDDDPSEHSGFAPDGNDPYVPEGSVIVRAVSEKAVLVDVDGLEIWIPTSQLMAGTTVAQVGDRGTLVIPYWLAVKKGLL